jgi:anti-sigma B factor antagonist
MLNINKQAEEGRLYIFLEGRLDTITSPELEAELTESLEGVSELVLDLEQLDYISSAGLRVLLSAQKKMNKQGTLKVLHVNDTVKEIFNVTGFTDILNIE